MKICPVLRKVPSFSTFFVPVTKFSQSSNFLLSRLPPSSSWQACRSLSTLKLTKNLELLTDTLKPLTLKAKDKSSKSKFSIEAIQSNNGEDVPLLVLPTWLMAEKKHVLKYANLYLDQGFHVLWVVCRPGDLLFPTLNGAKAVGNDLLAFLMNNPQYKSKMIHGFSVGGFVWSQLLLQFDEQPDKYRALMDSFRGQIWDSLVDIEGLSGGVGGAVFPNNAILRTLLEWYGKFHVKAFHELAMRHYLDARRVYYNPIVKCPAIHFCSEDDPVALFYCVKRITDIWKENGIKTNVKCWKTSQHILHFQKHPEEYRRLMKDFLDEIGLLKYPDKFPVEVPVSAPVVTPASIIHQETVKKRPATNIQTVKLSLMPKRNYSSK